jgi:hypothetical protein
MTLASPSVSERRLSSRRLVSVSAYVLRIKSCRRYIVRQADNEVVLRRTRCTRGATFPN